MANGLIWANAEDLARNRGKVLSLYRQILRSLNYPDLPLMSLASQRKLRSAPSSYLDQRNDPFTTLLTLSISPSSPFQFL
ncbi:hypothetical protein MA16_Dca014197 [Dendrobium catenatum]|uniref:LYR motif containing domain-containing protein n=1 Tax=Dendrobium catenatum TaxID=906689 RepID=A0A2I0VZ87_9ASPA|nr:hypothetical protein MA16_Dca023927 [Dendrobium catenatum]PKU68727.1 hypothetical protein MA16_Dca014197 [Dendrobium catenatum]